MAVVVVPGFELVPARPPVTRTLPVASSAAVLPKRHSVAVPQAARPPSAADHWPVDGLYSSLNTPAVSTPAVTSTSPPGSRVASCPSRGVLMLPVGAHLPVA